MAIVKIRLFGDRCLRRRAQIAPAGAEETRALLENLWETLVADGGVGLAAPQIGVNRRVVVIRDPGRPEGQQRLDLVNPVVQRTFGSEVPFEEGCLSFPGLYTDVIRPQGVELVYETPGQNELQHLRTDKVLARIILHEVDHLDGVLFVDHLNAVDRCLLGPRLLWITLRRLNGR